MTKIRPKDLKPNKDFKKVKAKVGKKIERSNVTRISVQSRRINLPAQDSLLGSKNNDDDTRLRKILKQLNHFNVSARGDALNDLKQFLQGSQNTESLLGNISFAGIIQSFIFF